MTQAMEYDFQRLVLERLDKIDGDISGVGTRLGNLETRLDSLDVGLDKAEFRFDIYVKASEKIERLATTIIITAGTVTLLAPVLQAIYHPRFSGRDGMTLDEAQLELIKDGET